MFLLSDDSVTSQDSLNITMESQGDQSLELNTVSNTGNPDSEQLLPQVRTVSNHTSKYIGIFNLVDSQSLHSIITFYYFFI